MAFLTDATGNVNNQYVDGISGVQAPTRVVAESLNMLQNEICFVVTATGGTLIKSNNGQLYAAIQQMVSETALGYTPVRQGGGIGQLSNTVDIGWSSAGKLKATVDSTDLGAIAFEPYVASNYLNLAGGTVNGNLTVAGQLNANTVSAVGDITTASRFSSQNGMITSGIIQAGITAPNASPFDSSLPGIVIYPEGQIDSYSTGFKIGTSVGVLMAFQSSGNQCGSITASGNSTSYNTSSDYRLKENLTPLTGAIDRVKNIPIYRGNFTTNPAEVDLVLAHELATAVPEAVTGQKDETKSVTGENGEVTTTPVYQAVDFSKCVPLMLAAMQELSEQVAELQAQIGKSA